MSRREQAERLLDAIGEIQYELVEAAAQPQRKKIRSLGVIAAVILLALLVPTIPIAVNFLVGSGHSGAAESGPNVLGLLHHVRLRWTFRTILAMGMPMETSWQ